MANIGRAWRDGLPLRHRSTIFPEDLNALAGEEVDILITHEAPSSHKYGHAEIDDLAEIKGVKVIVHGHTHQDYRATLPNGVEVVGLGRLGFCQQRLWNSLARHHAFALTLGRTLHRTGPNF